MITQKYIYVYRVKHRGLIDTGELVLADNVNDAINKFNEYYKNDYDIQPDGITGVTLEHQLEIICDE